MIWNNAFSYQCVPLVKRVKQGQTVHKTATERKAFKEANIHSSIQIHRHRGKRTRKKDLDRHKAGELENR